jgi:predicted Zn finger-like uncharacterized protein
MKIVCPSCAATYEVPESVVSSKRAVRCARCGGDWVPGAADTAPAPPAEVTPEPVPAPAFVPAAEEMADFEPAPAWPEPENSASDLEVDGLEMAGLEVDGPFIAPPLIVPVESLGTPPSQNLAAAIAEEAAASPAGTDKKAPITAWIASVALLAILILAAVAFREPVMKAWPASTRLYAALGLYRP